MAIRQYAIRHTARRGSGSTHTPTSRVKSKKEKKLCVMHKVCRARAKPSFFFFGAIRKKNPKPGGDSGRVSWDVNKRSAFVGPTNWVGHFVKRSESISRSIRMNHDQQGVRFEIKPCILLFLCLRLSLLHQRFNFWTSQLIFGNIKDRRLNTLRYFH